MARNLKLADATAETAVDAIAPLLNDGYLRLYTGSQPTDPDTAIGAQVLLSEHRFSATAFGAAVDGVAAAAAITSDTALATGTAAWFRALEDDGTTPVIDGSVGTSAGTFDCVVNSTAFVSGADVDVDSMNLTLPLA